MSCKSGPACVYESDTSAERVDETAKDRQEDWYGQHQWRCGYERGWDKAMEAKREWVGLTDKDIYDIREDFIYNDEDFNEVGFARAIEAKLKEKNFG
jgi:hypothetical protein